MTDLRDFWHILPHYVKKNVVHYLDWKTRCNLSYCSKSDNKLVKSTPITFHKMLWRSGDLDAPSCITFETLNCPVKQVVTRKFDDTQQIVHRMGSVLRAPNKVENFTHYGDRSDGAQSEMGRLIRDLKNQDVRLKIDSLVWTCTRFDIFYDFLACVDADHLRRLSMCLLGETEEQVARIVATEQFKNAKLVSVQQGLNSMWWLESVVEKPKYTINLDKLSVDKARWIIKTYQEKNHPVGSLFLIQFPHNLQLFKDLYEEPGRLIEAGNSTIYEKTFPLADEACELRVQLNLTSAQRGSDADGDELYGTVVRKDSF